MSTIHRVYSSQGGMPALDGRIGDGGEPWLAPRQDCPMFSAPVVFRPISECLDHRVAAYAVKCWFTFLAKCKKRWKPVTAKFRMRADVRPTTVKNVPSPSESQLPSACRDAAFAGQ